MNNLIKHIVEAFDFDTVNKQKNGINVYDTLYLILSKIKNSDIDKISEDEYNLLTLTPSVYKVTNKNALGQLIEHFINLFGYECNLNWIDVSKVTDMSYLFDGSIVKPIGVEFNNSKFNGDISQWDVSNVINMNNMFWQSSFNGDISKWNVSRVTDMGGMFFESVFNRDISKWDVSNVTDMGWMFHTAKFNGDISNWNVSNVTNMSHMFYNSEFNRDISNWNVSNVTNMESMFENSIFASDISKWDINIIDKSKRKRMFFNSSIKNKQKPKFKILEAFDFDTVDKSKKRINARPQIQQDTLNKFLTGERLTDEEKVVINNLPDRYYAIDDETELKSFIDKCVKVLGKKCNLNWIDISGIDDMSRMFMYSSFNGDISRWDVAHVIKMNYMFYNSEFNGDISNWNVELVEDMHGMFELSVFNLPIPNWTFRYIKTTRDMFKRSQFNQDISKWRLRYTTFTKNMFLGCPIKKEYKPDLSNTNKQY